MLSRVQWLHWLRCSHCYRDVGEVKAAREGSPEEGWGGRDRASASVDTDEVTKFSAFRELRPTEQKQFSQGAWVFLGTALQPCSLRWKSTR